MAMVSKLGNRKREENFGFESVLSVPSLTNLLWVLRSVYLPAVPAAAASSGQCSLSLSGVKIVKISPHWGLEPGPLGN